jgi:hypothetical protein
MKDWIEERKLASKFCVRKAYPKTQKTARTLTGDDKTAANADRLRKPRLTPIG